MSNIDGGLRKLFHDNLPGHWQAVESGLTGGGIPDTSFCWNGVEGWIEFKQTKATAIKFRPGQVPWISRRVRNGGRVLVAVRQKHEGGVRKGIAVDYLWLYRIRTHEDIVELNEIGLQKEPDLCSWQWARVRAVVFGE